MKIYKVYSLLIIFLSCGIIHSYAQGLQRADKLAFHQEVSVVPDDFPKVNISLDLRDMEIIEALKYIATKANLNIIPTKEVSGRTSLMVDSVPAKDVFDIILRSNNLAYEKKGDIYNVMTENEYKARYGKNFIDTRVTRVFNLKYAIPEQAYNLLNTLKSEIGKILLDQDSGVILVMDTAERVKSMESTLQAMEQKNVIIVFDLKYARAKDIEEQLKPQIDVKKLGSIKADERTNQVIVQTLPERMEDISRLIQSLDKKTKQILLDAKIIQVKLTDSVGSGVEWEGLFNLGKKWGTTYLGSYPLSSVGPSTTATSNTWRSRKEVVTDTGYVGSYPFSGTTTDFSASTAKTATEEMHLGVVGKNDFDTIIHYLQTLGETRILSNPKLAVVNNQEAKIHVGERQAYITTTTTQTQTSTTVSEAVTYVDVGIQMMVTPTINDDGFVTVKVKPEISSVISFLETSSKNKIPIIDTSTAETIVMVKDGSSILIGGLSKEEKTLDSSGTPFLSKIPFFGDAFKTKTNKKVRAELVILLTPHVVEGDELVTGYDRDFGHALDKEYQKYQDFSEENAPVELKAYENYQPIKQDVDRLPVLKPVKGF
jgi:type II secretory pathway component GspD/PulD (secretin)